MAGQTDKPGTPRNADEIEADLRRTRSRMDRTLTELQRRLTPRNLVGEAIGRVTSRGRRLLTDAKLLPATDAGGGLSNDQHRAKAKSAARRKAGAAAGAVVAGVLAVAAVKAAKTGTKSAKPRKKRPRKKASLRRSARS